MPFFKGERQKRKTCLPVKPWQMTLVFSSTHTAAVLEKDRMDVFIREERMYLEPDTVESMAFLKDKQGVISS